ncbi:hypothetical protein BGE01nite_10200 [Brevifollis gellanilyticus]|uniref:HTTM domain-containing protein n=2 Tax=Brevifollis gellanilyticus TaxID=748831 RepID=A0A512M4S9_9BACT|nr:hypothetical protein BGE01nite_10200 [Brevifollis gellanilyticus]
MSVEQVAAHATVTRMAATASPSASPPRSLPWKQCLGMLAVLGAIFGLYRLVRLPAEKLIFPDYAGSFLLAALVKNLSHWPFWLGAGLGGLFAWQNREWRTWRGFFPGGKVHYVAWAIIVILTWTTALYPYNYFYGQAHLLDRVIILILGVAALRRPSALPLLMFGVMYSYLQWRGAGLSDAEFTNRKMILDMAYMLGAAGLARPWIVRWFPQHLPALTVAFVGANIIHYWMPGLAKLEIGQNWLDWTLHDDLYNLTVSTFLYGWNALWDQAGVIRLHETLQPFGLPLKLFVIFVEVALLAAFWNRRWFVLLAVGRAMLHMGILVFSGDTFWNWILTQLAIVAAFWSKPSDDEDAAKNHPGSVALFSLPMMLTAMAYMLITAHSHKASTLAWFDSQITERYALHAVMEDGRRLYITPTFFEPYDFPMIQAQYHYLQLADGGAKGEKILTRTFGAIHEWEKAHEMRGVTDVEQARALVQKLGTLGKKPADDVKLIPYFDKFIRTWMKNYQAHKGTLADVLHFLSPPLHAYVYSTQPPDKTYHGEPGVKKVEVEFERILFDGKAFHDLDRRVIREITME